MILSFLKITGISVIVLLLLLMFLLILLLFVPFQYRIYGSMPAKKEQEAGEKARLAVNVSFLLFFFCLSLEYAQGKKKSSIRILGIPVIYRRRKKKQGKKETEKQEASVLFDEREKTEDAKLEDEVPEKLLFDEEEIKKQDGIETEVQSAEENQVLKSRKVFFQYFSDFWRNITGFLKALPEFLDGMRTFFGNIKNFGKNLQKQQRNAADVWNNVHVRNGISFAWKKMQQVLLHIRPHKVKGRIHFGLPDPAVTGWLLGICSIVYAFYGDTIQIEPDFEQTVLDGEFRVSGNIQLFVPLWAAWALYRNREVRYAMKRIRGIGYQ